ncbi:MAG: alpha/beta hydrolase [Myxococcales bacterium]|nr:alpha/beta hydrolase [Myxococcales bacterium]
MRYLWILVFLAGCGTTPVEMGDLGSGDAAGLSDGGDGGAPQTGKTTVIRVHYPAGIKKIAIRGAPGQAGGPLDWEKGKAMVAGAEDVWTFQSEAITVATEWKPLLDDVTWSRGPNYRVEAGATVDVWPHFTSTHGEVVKLIASFHSAKLKSDRTIWAYLPASYGENTRARFPSLYMHDAQNLFDAKVAFGGREWRVDETLDGAAEDGTIREAIVVGIANSAERIYELTPTEGGMGGGGGDAYLAMIVEEVKPKVDGMLRTRPGREETGVLGSSLGGLISSYAGCKRGVTFGLVGAMSPSTWWDQRVLLGLVTASKGQGMMMRPLRVYVDSGDSGPSMDGAADTEVLAERYRGIGYSDGVDFKFVVQKGGQHNEMYWAERLPGALGFLLGPR